MGGGILGFDAIMKLQSWITIATTVLTVGYVVLTLKDIKMSTVMSVPSGSTQAFIGALIFGLVGFGLGWLNSGADYSRYLPRSTSSRAVVGWTMFGASIAPILLVVFGALLAASDKDLSSKIAADPIGALTTLLPTWYLIPFAIVAILGLVGGSVLALYSSGLALISIGVKIPRAMAAGIDGMVMIIGTIYVVWIASDFFGPFQGFLITLGVPLAAWGGIFIADVVLRKSEYRDEDLYRDNGIYGSINFKSLLLLAAGSIVGWGLVTNTFASWLSWQGFLLKPLGFGGKEGAWAYANLGVLAALAIGFVGYYLSAKSDVARQEQLSD
ncbi:permease for cytosine/purines, uracil, thiamine, allantoin [mine drainage metagenome]|uniref:Permease for cytosine/purines, uracil, thiamine, allantoin n=1 Tax=mine drainage metagenome TaxID=410659 RepID=A0A1J5Q9N9_9ZZZZ